MGMIIELVGMACIGNERYLTLKGDGTAENFKQAPEQIVVLGTRYWKRGFNSDRFTISYR